MRKHDFSVAMKCAWNRKTNDCKLIAISQVFTWFFLPFKQKVSDAMAGFCFCWCSDDFETRFFRIFGAAF